MSDEGKNSAMEKAMQLLSEQYDTVQIIASTIDDDGDTAVHYSGSGNLYGRLGSVRDWLRETEAKSEAEMHRRVREYMDED